MIIVFCTRARLAAIKDRMLVIPFMSSYRLRSEEYIPDVETGTEHHVEVTLDQDAQNRVVLVFLPPLVEVRASTDVIVDNCAERGW